MLQRSISGFTIWKATDRETFKSRIPMQLHLGSTEDHDPSLDSSEARSKLVIQQQKQYFSNFEDLDNLCFDFPVNDSDGNL
ncbi:hypothetical protein L1887_08883 [Cichorium endivia]|nr:hypothetical protein L1887_08883 [Cichorium endivia]